MVVVVTTMLCGCAKSSTIGAKMQRALAVMLLMAAWSPVSYATDRRTDQLYWQCAGRDNFPELGLAMCAGYLDGVLDMHAIMVGFVKAKPMFCVPQTGISIEQAIRVFNQWVQQNPTKMHEGARGSVIIALRGAFPCRDVQ